MAKTLPKTNVHIKSIDPNLMHSVLSSKTPSSGNLIDFIKENNENLLTVIGSGIYGKSFDIKNIKSQEKSIINSLTGVTESLTALAAFFASEDENGFSKIFKKVVFGSAGSSRGGSSLLGDKRGKTSSHIEIELLHADNFDKLVDALNKIDIKDNGIKNYIDSLKALQNFTASDETVDKIRDGINSVIFVVNNLQEEFKKLEETLKDINIVNTNNLSKFFSNLNDIINNSNAGTFKNYIRMTIFSLIVEENIIPLINTLKTIDFDYDKVKQLTTGLNKFASGLNNLNKTLTFDLMFTLLLKFKALTKIFVKIQKSIDTIGSIKISDGVSNVIKEIITKVVTPINNLKGTQLILAKEKVKRINGMVETILVTLGLLSLIPIMAIIAIPGLLLLKLVVNKLGGIINRLSSLPKTGIVKSTQNLGGIIGLIALASIALGVAALTMKIVDLKILLFPVLLAAFILEMFGICKILSKLTMPAMNSMGKFGLLVIAASIILLLGGFVLSQNMDMIIGSFAFAAILGMFMLAVIAPFKLFGIIGKKTELQIKGFGATIAMIAIVMLLGGAIVEENMDLIIGSFKFAGMMVAFMLAICLPWGIMGFLMRGAQMQIKGFGRTILMISIVMLLGGVIMEENMDLIIGSFKFAATMFAFMMAVCLPMVFAKGLVKQGTKTLLAFTLLIAVAAMTMMIGGIIFEDNPDLFGDHYKDGSIFKFTVCLGLFIGTMGVVIWAVSKLVNGGKALITSLLMAGVIAALAISLFVADLCMREVSFINMVLFVGCISVLAGLFYIIGHEKFMMSVLKGEAVAAVMAAVIALLGFCISFASRQMEDVDIEALGIMIAATAIFAVVFGILGTVASYVALGSLTAAAIGIVVGLLGYAYSFASEKMQGVQLEDFITMLEITGIFALLFGILGTISVFIALGSLAAAAIATVVMHLGVALKIVSDVMKNLTLLQATEFIGIVTMVIGIFGLLTPLSPILYICAKLIDPLTNVIMKLSLALFLVASVMKMVSEVDVAKSSETIAEMIGSINTMIEGFREFGGDDVKQIKKMSVIGKGIAEVVREIALAIKDYAELKIPVTDDNGKVTGYRQLTQDDFAAAANNVGIVITTIGNAMLQVYNSNPELFESSFMGLGETKFEKVSKACQKMSKVISKIAVAVKDYAELKIPTGWDKDGNPTSYRALTETDFKNAANNISTVITLLAKTLIGLYNDPNNKDLFEVDFGGLGSSKITKICKVAQRMGDVISTIASALKDYADLKMPTAFGKDGKPTDYRQMTSDDFKKASENIGIVVTTLALALKDTYDKNETMFKDPFIGDSKIAKVLNVTDKIGTAISSISKSLVDYADLKMPKYDADGKVLKDQYIKLDDSIFERVGLNVAKLITTLATSVMTATANVDFDKVLKAVQETEKVVKVIANISSSLCEISSGKIASEFNENGSVKTYKQVNFDEITENGKKIVTAITGFISQFENVKIDKGAIKEITKILSSEIKTIFNSIKDIFETLGDIVSSSNFVSISNQAYNVSSIIASLILNIFTIKKLPRNLNKTIDTIKTIYTEKLFPLIKSLNTEIDTSTTVNNLKTIENDIVPNLQKIIKDLTNNQISYSEIKKLNKSLNLQKITFSLLSEIMEYIFSPFTNDYMSGDSSELQLKLSTYSACIGTIKGIYNKMVLLFNEDNESTFNSTFINAFKNNLEDFITNINSLINIINNASEINEENVKGFCDAFEKLTKVLNNAGEIKSTVKLKLFSINLNGVVKVINSVDAQKMTLLNKFVEEMNMLSSQNKGLENLAKAISDKLSTALVQISTKLEFAANTINNAQKLEDARKRTITQCVDKLSEVMSQEINVTVVKEVEAEPEADAGALGGGALPASPSTVSGGLSTPPASSGSSTYSGGSSSGTSASAIARELINSFPNGFKVVKN